MARGWDSKAIEDQIADAEAAKAVRSAPVISTVQREALATIASLELSSVNIRHRIEAARDDRHRVQLQAALEHLESQLLEARAEAGAVGIDLSQSS